MDKQVTIVQGEALAALQGFAPESVDAVITDPPYSSGAFVLSGKQASPALKYQNTGTRKEYPPLVGDNKDQRSLAAWSMFWLFECWRIAKPGAPLLLFTDWRQLPTMTDAIQGAGWSWLGIVPWNKPSSRPQAGRFRAQCEYVLFASKGPFKPAHKACFPGIYSHAIVAKQKYHLTGKPVALLKDLMAITPPGGTILDPFLGGGSTAIAALETGRKCIGIELSPEYAAIAAQRVADCQKHG